MWYFYICRYLYCDEISLEADTVLPTLYAAKKYIMPHLTQACVDYLQTDLDASNACLLLSHSRLFDETELTQHCFDVIDSQTKEALQADSFTDIDYQTLELILRRDTLCVEETVVFAAARRWAEVECSRQGHPVTPEQCREVLGDALYLVRFPTMTPGEFADCAEQSDFLSKQEIVDIFFFFSAKNKPQLRFPTEPRKFQLRRFTPCTCSRFQATNSSGRFFLNGQRNCIRFSVDKAVFVSGFGLYGSCEVGVEYCIVIALEHDEVSLRRKRHKMTCDGSKKTIRVSFDAPFRIEANTYYTASLVVESAGRQPGQEHYGRSGVPHVKCENVIFTFKDSSVGENQSSVVQGQIPEILFHCWRKLAALIILLCLRL